MIKNPDIYLLGCIKSDNYKAFNQLYDKYWDSLYLYAYSLTKDKENAYKIIQDLFVMLWEKREEHNIQNLKSYLFQSVKYNFFQQHRKKSVSLVDLAEELEEFIYENLEDSNPEIFEILKKALEALPEKRREIIIMNKYQNMSPNEISEVLNISVQTVRNQLSSGLIQLRQHFNSKGNAAELAVIISIFYNI
ncbi:RNA polymerase sigma factor [Formosa sp. PL04]|uniref:RNA polymerase sigma factor n=1 Tax=Formosa sp. PL04 TaxID=3081755 RepID=UPI002980E50E|nr:sigma-70 family RNA polymerase sigma factor [Formosa sp. PL04]MDW5290974.1 sigma-70 family RNA polymerase sigma factor [Formosa sp. PL04]